MSWNPFKPEIMSDPANGHEELLQRCPVHRCDDFDPPFYTLSRYADVEAALRDIETFSSHYGQGPRFTDPQGMLCDPPQHTHMRKLVQQAFIPRAMNELRPRIEALTDQLIDDAIAQGNSFDFHDDFAFPLPVIIIAGMLGVPEEDLERFKHWSDIQVAAMGAEDPSQYANDQAEFLGYLTNHYHQRHSAIKANDSVPDDLLTLIAGARGEEGEYLKEADALSILSQLLVGGNETTTSLMTNLLWRLLEVPERWEKLVAKPELVENAIEESLRFDPPVLGLYRNTTRKVTLHDVTIPEGVKVLMNYAAANRDPAVYETPNEFDITRERGRHLAFGLGTHFCIGAPMARMETEIAFTKLIKRLPGLSLVNSGRRIPPFFLWGRSKLPVQVG